MRYIWEKIIYNNVNKTIIEQIKFDYNIDNDNKIIWIFLITYSSPIFCTSSRAPWWFPPLLCHVITSSLILMAVAVYFPKALSLLFLFSSPGLPIVHLSYSDTTDDGFTCAYLPKMFSGTEREAKPIWLVVKSPADNVPVHPSYFWAPSELPDCSISCKTCTECFCTCIDILVLF